MNGTCLKDWSPYASLYLSSFCKLGFAICYGPTGSRCSQSVLSPIEDVHISDTKMLSMIFAVYSLV